MNLLTITQKKIMRLVNEILSLLLGEKYYAVVVHIRNTELYELCNDIFPATEEGIEEMQSYIERLRENKTCEYADVVSFRSRMSIPCQRTRHYR